jgi:hypothetical protein
MIVLVLLIANIPVSIYLFCNVNSLDDKILAINEKISLNSTAT